MRKKEDKKTKTKRKHAFSWINQHLLLTEAAGEAPPSLIGCGVNKKIVGEGGGIQVEILRNGVNSIY